jgi:hypothetical protein
MGDRAKAMETLVLKCIALEFVAAIASGRKASCLFSCAERSVNPRVSRLWHTPPISFRLWPDIDVRILMTDPPIS